jgi:hypothetical protein
MAPLAPLHAVSHLPYINFRVTPADLSAGPDRSTSRHEPVYQSGKQRPPLDCLRQTINRVSPDVESFNLLRMEYSID